MLHDPKNPVSTNRRRTTAAPTECHGCGVVCEWVVYPAHCLRSGCRFAYSYEDEGRRYFGCIERVFTVELDLDAFAKAGRSDAFGALKARLGPRSECRSDLEEAYRFKYSWKSCSNPVFRQHPDDYAPDALRRLVHGAPKTRR